MKVFWKMLFLIALVALGIYSFLKIRVLTSENEKLNLTVEILTKQITIEKLKADSINVTSAFLREQLDEFQKQVEVKK